MISNPPIPKAYACNGSTTRFDFPFRFLDEADLRVQREAADGTLTELTLGDYTVFGEGLDAGGYIVTDTTYADGKIRIFLGMDTVQLNEYGNNDPFPAQSHEDALDRLTLLDAMRQEEFNRTIRSAFGEGNGAELPPVAERAGKLWVCNAEGDLIFAAGIDNSSVIADLSYATAYYGTNDDGLPRLVLDVDGAGTTPITSIPNPGGIGSARVMAQFSDAGGDHSLSGGVWLGGVFRNWTEANKPTDKRSKYTATIQSMSQVDGVYYAVDPRPNGTGGAVILGQEVGPLYLVAAIDNGVTNGKAEGLVCFAKQMPRYDKNGDDQGAAGQGKCVGGQFGTVMANAGPVPDDKTQLDTDDEDAATLEDELLDTESDVAQPFGEPQGGFTLRANGAGAYRSWAGLLIGGRAGHFNGVVMNIPKAVDGGDADGMYGIKGVWGGRSFWQKETVALYAKDSCPGWATIGWDGIARTGHTDIGIPNTGDSGARGPVDIVVDTGSAPANWTGAVMLFNGVKLLGVRSTGWTAMTGTPSKGALAAAAAGTVSAGYVQAEAQASRNRIAALEARLAAYDAALIAHGLIGA